MAELTLPDVFPLVQYDLRLVENSSVNAALSGLRSIYRRTPVWTAKLTFAGFDKVDHPNWQQFESWLHAFSAGADYSRIPVQFRDDRGILTGRKSIGAIPSSVTGLQGGGNANFKITQPQGAQITSVVRLGTHTFSLSQSGRLYRNSVHFRDYPGRTGKLLNHGGSLAVVVETGRHANGDYTDFGIIFPSPTSGALIGGNRPDARRVTGTNVPRISDVTPFYHNETVYLLGDGFTSFPASALNLRSTGWTPWTFNVGRKIVSVLSGPNPWIFVYTFQNKTYLSRSERMITATDPLFANTTTLGGAYQLGGRYYGVEASSGQEKEWIEAGQGDITEIVARNNEVRFANPTSAVANQDGDMLMIGKRMFQLIQPLNRGGSVTQAYIVPNPAFTVEAGDHVAAATHFSCEILYPGRGTPFPMRAESIDGFSLDVIEHLED